MKNEQSIERLPLIPLRGKVIFPNTITTIDIARPKSLGALKQAMDGDSRVFVVAQQDPAVESPSAEDLYAMGTLATVRQIIQLPDHTARVLLEGTDKARLRHVYEDVELQRAVVTRVKSAAGDMTVERMAMMRVCLDMIVRLLDLRHTPMGELVSALQGEKDADEFCDIAASGLVQALDEAQVLLECENTDRRLKMLLEYLSQECGIAQLEETIRARVQESMERANHDYYLREQMRVISDELGEDEDEEIAELRKRLAESKMPKEAHERVEKELKRLARTSIQAPESSVSQNYIEYMLDLPWEKYDKSVIDLKKARRVLDEDHFGMKEVKERLLEYLAVRSVTDRQKSPILCLVGPPGVGKTSIARSVARALGRKFTQMSLGGVHDEAEIRGHRRTYVGAMPGRIISSINQEHVMNPVFLLDEIDKMSRDMRGDPASAMLEVLDPEQNDHFRDHYLEAPFDLSDVLFITTANTTATIDRALLDRMEVIEVSSYTLEEKIQIAKRHLYKKQLEKHALTRDKLRITDGAYRAVIEGYTRESGVRTLEKRLGRICRKVTMAYVEDPDMAPVRLKPQDIEKYLGPVEYLPSSRESDAVGVVNGLAWTEVGGEVMPVVAETFPGKGALELTGKLGDVMKESALLARSVVRKRLARCGLDTDFFEKNDVHIHVPEGAVPKDGPSAGVALTCALLSAVTGCEASNRYAMTGEITLHGKVLPIGGVKEKLLAAYRLGITDILLPRENNKDLKEIDEDVLSKIEVTLIDTVEDAIRLVIPALEEKTA